MQDVFENFFMKLHELVISTRLPAISHAYANCVLITNY